MRDILRFPIDAADQARVVVSSIQVSDTPGGANVLPIAQTLRLSFTVSNPGAGAPKLRPLFHGKMVFIPDPLDPRMIPTPDIVDFSQHGLWRTRGTLLVVHLFDKAEHELKEISGGALEVGPNGVWYFGINLTKDFLQITLGARKQPIPGVNVSVSSPDWIKHAVSGFLGGTFLPELRLGATPAADDAAVLPMPELEMDAATGLVTLDITTARSQAPRDASDDLFKLMAGSTKPGDPRHPQVGRIPARHVLRSVRAKMIDGQVGQAVPDAILNPPNDVGYVTLRFTRIWKPEEDISAHFPKQTVEVKSGSTVLMTQTLPPHGIVHVPVNPTSPPQSISVRVIGTMLYLDGATPNAWQQPGGTPTLTFNLPSQPHILMRQHMSEEMLVEWADETKSNACTYYSLRRSLRALVNNRIAGGRLNYGRQTTSKTTAKLIDDAFAGNSFGAKASIIANNAPRTNVSISSDIHAAAIKLIPICNMFFPGTAPAQMLNGATAPVTPITNGQLFYDLWQSAASSFENANLARNYPAAHIGRGAPGALVALGLAAGYVVSGERNAGESDVDYWDRLVRNLQARMKPGGALQLWALEIDFKTIKQRQWMTVGLQSYGHSPIFHHNGSDARGPIVHVFDQFGVTSSRVLDISGKLRLSWADRANPIPEEVWIGANWIE
jgi:hypothetical protein